ncbi:hypothetical protein TCAL_08634 [Tigriopus californicus]|uniref:EB domain-containing protein n=1 Tax=Tigriopus californicus TaxID=6832 RepID=A0A553NU86_TIGCA|nr:hypothetical protein TCAL_08634 [Tigriopus californicus]
MWLTSPYLCLTLLTINKEVLGDSSTNCVYDVDCSNEFHICQYGSCVPDVPCRFNLDCQDGICLKDQCVWKPCRFKDDCLEGQSCGTESNICSPATCQNRLDCPSGQTCNRVNQCDRVQCWNDGECPVDLSCQYGQCVPISCVTGSSDCSEMARICVDDRCVRKSCQLDTDCRVGTEYCLGSFCAIDPGCRLCSSENGTNEGWNSFQENSRTVGSALGNVQLEKDDNEGCQSSQVCQNEVGILHSCVQGKCVELICDNQSDCPSHHTCFKGTCIFHGTCLLSNDCHPQAICTKGHCHFSHCNLHTDCSKGFLCSQEFQCVPNKCQTKQDCPANFVCHENGHCENGGCADEADCAPIGDCIEGHCQEISCTDDGQCQAHRFCLEGFCTLGPCQDVRECQDEEVCLRGYCVPDPLCICPKTSEDKDANYKHYRQSLQEVEEALESQPQFLL